MARLGIISSRMVLPPAATPAAPAVTPAKKCLKKSAVGVRNGSPPPMGLCFTTRVQLPSTVCRTPVPLQLFHARKSILCSLPLQQTHLFFTLLSRMKIPKNSTTQRFSFSFLVIIRLFSHNSREKDASVSVCMRPDGADGSIQGNFYPKHSSAARKSLVVPEFPPSCG